MQNWYAVKNMVTGLIVSFVSDDSSGFVLNPPGLQMLGPYATQQAAVAANQPIVFTPQQQLITALQAKPAANWTLADVAAWLQAKG